MLVAWAALALAFGDKARRPWGGTRDRRRVRLRADTAGVAQQPLLQDVGRQRVISPVVGSSTDTRFVAMCSGIAGVKVCLLVSAPHAGVACERDSPKRILPAKYLRIANLPESVP